MSILSEQAQRRIGIGCLSVIILIAAVLGILWMIYVAAPGPEEVCDHIVDLTYQAAGDDRREAAESQVERLQERCVEDKQTKIQLRGKIEWKTYATCVMEAADLEAAERC